LRLIKIGEPRPAAPRSRKAPGRPSRSRFRRGQKAAEQVCALPER